jgi:hypothetical protein
VAATVYGLEECKAIYEISLEKESSNVDLNELANSNAEIKGSISDVT